MKAEVKSVHLIDHELDKYRPDDPRDFHLAAEALIGISGQEGADIFSFDVSTPSWFSKNRTKVPTFVRHWIFMDHFDPQALKALVRRTVADTEGETWDEIATKLARYMFWEFEDYQPFEA